MGKVPPPPKKKQIPAADYNLNKNYVLNGAPHVKQIKNKNYFHNKQDKKDNAKATSCVSYDCGTKLEMEYVS
jgi:hypothetical protein